MMEGWRAGLEVKDGLYIEYIRVYNVLLVNGGKFGELGS